MLQGIPGRSLTVAVRIKRQVPHAGRRGRDRRTNDGRSLTVAVRMVGDALPTPETRADMSEHVRAGKGKLQRRLG